MQGRARTHDFITVASDDKRDKRRATIGNGEADEAGGDVAAQQREAGRCKEEHRHAHQPQPEAAAPAILLVTSRSLRPPSLPPSLLRDLKMDAARGRSSKGTHGHHASEHTR